MSSDTDLGTRRGETREAIVRSAAALLDEGGVGAVTTRAVAQAAGVQAPTIYRLFGDKDGLIDAVAEHVMASYVADTAAAAAGESDPVSDLRDAWHRHVAFWLAHPTLFTMLADARREASSPAGLAGLDVLRTRVHRVAAAGLLRVSEERAVALIRATGTGVILTLLGTPAGAGTGDLAETAWDAVRGALLTGSAASAVAADEDPVAAAVTFRTAVPHLPALRPAERALMAEWLDRVIDHAVDAR